MDRTADNIIKCHSCPLIGKNGRCGADHFKRDIVTIATKNECPAGYFGATPNDQTTAFVQLSRLGDILNILPLFRHLAIQQGEPVTVVVNQQYFSLVAGLSYLRPICHFGYEGDPVGGAELAKPYANNVCITQCWNNPIDLDGKGQSQTYDQSSWEYAGYLDLWGTLPLILDNRDRAAERKLVAQHVGDFAGPVILVSTYGRSSPYPEGAAAELLQCVQEAAPEAKIVDLDKVWGERFQDLCGLYERASCVVASDTGTLHLSQINRLPTIGLVNDRPWRASARHSHWQDRLTYSESRTAEGKQRIRNALASALEAPRKRRIIQVIDGEYRPADPQSRRREWRAADTWHGFEAWETIRFTGYSRSSADLGDTRRLPFLVDMIDWAVSQAEEGDIVCLTNSDICIVPEGPESIRAAMVGAECAYSTRAQVQTSAVPLTRADLAGMAPDAGFADGGCDLYAFTPAWWRKRRNDLGDYLLGCNLWDITYTKIMLKDNPQAAIQPMILYHEKHESFWKRKENVADNAGQKHNGQQWADWCKKYGEDVTVGGWLSPNIPLEGRKPEPPKEKKPCGQCSRAAKRKSRT